MLLIFATSQICGLVSSRVVFNEEANGRKEKHTVWYLLFFRSHWNTYNFPGFHRHSTVLKWLGEIKLATIEKED